MKHPESLKQALRRLRKEGWTYGQLSRFSGIEGRTINRWCNRESASVANEKNKQWYKDNREHARRVAKESYHANLEKNRQRVKEWAENNKERKAQYQKEYRRQNLSACRLNESIRRARKRNAPGPHSEIEKLMIKYLYEDCRRISRETGVKHEVDHIIPLSKGGPHLPWNLRIITAKENREKYNKA